MSTGIEAADSGRYSGRCPHIVREVGDDSCLMCGAPLLPKRPLHEVAAEVVEHAQDERFSKSDLAL